jgi:hypothetical protein
MIKKLHKYLSHLNKSDLKKIQGGLTANPIVARQIVNSRVVGYVDPRYQQVQPIPQQVYQQVQPIPHQVYHQVQPMPIVDHRFQYVNPIPHHLPVTDYQQYLPIEKARAKSLSMPKINKNCYIYNIDIGKEYTINELLFPNKYEKYLNVQVSVDAFRLYQIIMKIMDDVIKHKNNKSYKPELSKFIFVCYSLKILLTTDSNYINRVLTFFKYYLDNKGGYKDKYDFNTKTNELKINMDDDNELRVFLTYNKLFGTIDIKIVKETDKNLSVSRSEMVAKSLNITKNKSLSRNRGSISTTKKQSISNSKKRSNISSEFFKSSR